MADIILFRPETSKLKCINNRPPVGLLFIAAPLIKNGFNVKILDEVANFSWLEELYDNLDASTICVGISSMTGGQILNGLKFAKIVKSKFNIPIVWGGLHPSILPEQTLENELVDIVVHGEGEEAFLKIVTALQNGRDLDGIPSVGYKKDGKIRVSPRGPFVDLKNFSPLPYHLIDCESYVKKSRFPGFGRAFYLHSDRGCPHRCGFCYNLNINECKWRTFTAFDLVEQIEYLVKKLRINELHFISDNFFVEKNRVADFCHGIIKKNIKVAWHTDCRVDYFSEYEDSFIDLLKKSGCKSLTFGVESGSQKILDLIHKDITLEQLFIAHEKIKKWRLGANYHFMVGFPDENKEDVLQTYKIMQELYDKYPRTRYFGPSIYTPYPGTPLYFRCLKMGFRPPDKFEDWATFDWRTFGWLSSLNPEYWDWLKKSLSGIAHLIHR